MVAFTRRNVWLCCSSIVFERTSGALCAPREGNGRCQKCGGAGIGNHSPTHASGYRCAPIAYVEGTGRDQKVRAASYDWHACVVAPSLTLLVFARKNRKLDIELDQKARLQVLEQEQHVELVKLRAQVKELSEIKALAESLQVELTKERSNSKSSKETLSVQTTQLQAARRRIKDLERENRSHEASLSDATKELEDLRKKSSDFDLTRDVEITSIRKEMNLKHQEALALWKKDTEERLHGVEKEVRHYFEGVVQGFKSQVEDLSLELDSTKKELDRTAIDYEESLQVRQSLTEKVAHLEREYREERTKFKEDRKKYESTLEHFRATKFAKEQEFNDLMDVKIALDAEITTYRRILDREETRVGLPTPTNTPNAKQTPRKRKSETGTAAAAKRAKRAPSSVQIVHLDLEKDRIVLENSSDKPVSLAGWEVRGRSENQVFRFPGTYSMRPQSKMTVYSSKRNKNAKDERKPNEDSFLATKFSLNASGDFAVLLTAEGVPVSTRAEGLSAEEVKSLEAEIKAELDDDAPPAEGVRCCCGCLFFVAFSLVCAWLTHLCSDVVSRSVESCKKSGKDRRFLMKRAAQRHTEKIKKAEEVVTSLSSQWHSLPAVQRFDISNKKIHAGVCFYACLIVCARKKAKLHFASFSLEWWRMHV